MSTPVQALLVVDSPKPVTIQSPDVTGLVKEYTEVILPLSSYAITTTEQYIQANQHWTTAKNYCDRVEEMFSVCKKAAHAAHKAITSLESQLIAPGKQIADRMHKEIMRWNAYQERLRREAEAALERAQTLERESERQRLQAIADAERAEALAKQAQLEPWEIEDEVSPEPVKIELPPPPPVRIASTVPTIAGGPRVVEKPWACVITDPVKLLTWILENPAERLQFVSWNEPALNSKARELGDLMEKTVPGTRAIKELTLKRS